MGLSSDEKARARQIANLRPISADPARASAQAHKTGIATRPKCQGKRRNGDPCKGVAAYGTTRCVTHGARTILRNKGLPVPPRDEFRLRRQAAYREWVDTLYGKTLPRDLLASDHWRATETLSRYMRRLRQIEIWQAWQAAQNGHWNAWRNL